MAENAGDHAGQPAWFTSERMLLILCSINMLNYVDRGAIASNGVNGFPGNSTSCVDGVGGCIQGEGIQGEFSLTYFQDGILSSAFMVGLLFASPIFAELTKTFNPMRLIGVGLLVWTVATSGCGFSWGFWSITFFRCLVGVAEASFISLAAPFIDDYAPPGQKTVWLSIFYMCIPVGIALGYVFGGVVGGTWGWRAAFWVESSCMLPFAVFGFFSDPVHLKGRRTASPEPQASGLLQDGHQWIGDSLPSQEGGGNLSWQPPTTIELVLSQIGGFFSDLKKLLLIKSYVVNCLGYIAYTFVLGAYSYWGPKAGQAVFNLENADILFGVVTILSGIFGTIFGGIMLDRIGSTIPVAFKFLSWTTLGGGICLCLAFLSKTLTTFIPMFAAGEFLLFATQGPVNFITLHSVPSDLRPLAIAMCTVSIHIFGDVPSSPIVGEIEDLLQNWRITSLVLTNIVFVAALFWGVGSFLEAKDEMQEDNDHDEGSVSLPEDGKPRSSHSAQC